MHTRQRQGFDTVPRKYLLSGHPAHGTEDAWLNDANLLCEKGVTGGNFLFMRIPIVGRPAFHDVGDEYLMAIDVGVGKGMVKEPTRFSHKGSAVLVFLPPWRLTNEHEGCITRSFASHCMSSAPMQWTIGAGCDAGCNGFERGHGHEL
jgi:hypothetical protein